MNRGFTLIELLIALFVASLLVAFVTIVVGTIKVVRDASYENIAFHIAEDKLDELRASGYASLSTGGSFSSPQLARLPQGSASTSVSVVNSKTKEVSAGVSWRGDGEATRVVSLTTLVTEIGGL